jgi:hypothetical protein
MDFITSSSTIILQASLTETGRRYLFGVDKNNNQIRFVDGTDQFKPIAFSVYDGDTNYKSSSLLSSGNVPNIKGLEKTTILSTCANSYRKTFVINSKGFNSNISFERASYNINEIGGYNLSINFNLGQNFNFQSGIKKFLIYNDTTTSTYTGATISGFSSITYNNISYFGKIFEISDEQTDFSVDLTIMSGGTLTQEQIKNIYLNILPISNCDLGLISRTNIAITGIIVPIKAIYFSPNYVNVNNVVTSSTIYSYINIGLSTGAVTGGKNNLNAVESKEFKKIRRADLKITPSNGLNNLRTSPLSIEILSPTKIDGNVNFLGPDSLLTDITQTGYKTIYTKDDICNFLESGRNIPLYFGIGFSVLIIKLSKPYISTISNSESIIFTYTNLNECYIPFSFGFNTQTTYQINV